MTPTPTDPSPNAAAELRDTVCRLIESYAPQFDPHTGIALGSEVERLADLILASTPAPSPAPGLADELAGTLWLWRNGEGKYLAFDNPFPTLDGGDPQTLGEPCGRAEFRPSVNGRPDYPEAKVERRILTALRQPDAVDAMREACALIAANRRLSNPTDGGSGGDWSNGWRAAVESILAAIRALKPSEGCPICNRQSTYSGKPADTFCAKHLRQWQATGQS